MNFDRTLQGSDVGINELYFRVTDINYIIVADSLI
jgi:hypothetical protein